MTPSKCGPRCGARLDKVDRRNGKTWFLALCLDCMKCGRFEPTEAEACAAWEERTGISEPRLEDVA